MFYYSCRSGSCPAITREASSYSCKKQIQRPTTSQGTEVERLCKHLVLNRMFPSNPSTHNSRPFVKCTGKIVRVSDDGKQGRNVFWKQQDWRTYKLPETGCMHRAFTSLGWGPSTEKGKWTWSPSPNPGTISDWPLTKEKTHFLQ